MIATTEFVVPRSMPITFELQDMRLLRSAETETAGTNVAGARSAAGRWRARRDTKQDAKLPRESPGRAPANLAPSGVGSLRQGQSVAAGCGAASLRKMRNDVPRVGSVSKLSVPPS